MAPPKKQKEESQLGPNFRKAQPKLRLVANGDKDVNAARAMQCGAVAVTGDDLIKEMATAAPSEPVYYDAEKTRQAKKGKLRSIPSEISVNLFVQTSNSFAPGTLSPRIFMEPSAKDKGTLEKRQKAKMDPNWRPPKTRETAQNTNLVTVRVKMSDLPKMLEKKNVIYAELAENVKTPDSKMGGGMGRPELDTRKIDTLEKKHKYGDDVLIGIIDVGGFDFSHPDFLDENGETRFLSIWDQGGSGRPNPYRRRLAENDLTLETYDYGSEILKVHMDTALKAAGTLGLPAYELEPQSQMAPGSHGTHVASIAAGNLGVARKSMIAAVLFGPPNKKMDKQTEYEERRTSFYDSTQIAHAVDYLMEVAFLAGKRLSINISLGTNGHAHDGSSPACRWIEAWLNKEPGTAVTVAAGNAGQEAGKTPGDLGYVIGRIHTSGQIPSRGLTTDIEWQVIGDGNQDMSENELEIWYSAQDRFGIQIRPPGMDWTEVINPREFIENRQMNNDSFLSVYNEIYHAANGLNCISVYLSPNLKVDPPIGSMTGLWRVRLYGIEIRNGNFHGWIERDDPRRVRLEDGREVQFLPSFFSEKSNVDNSSVNSLACGQRIISVANLDEPAEAINVTSSQGPTRDGRNKPDIAAPGTNIVAAKGFSDDDDQWVSMSGTSMAAPYVTGLIALMLGVNPKLTAAQTEGIIQSTAQPLPGGTYKWIDSAGFGRLTADLCLKRADSVNTRKDLTK